MKIEILKTKQARIINYFKNKMKLVRNIQN